jgi:peptidoglycan hydrolase-like protein with peptidoglycan-binding domain
MKKLFIYVALALLPLTSLAAVFSRNLTIGSRGDDVIALQELLMLRGELNLAQPTGYFGPLTKAAVKTFQASSSIASTGYFGPLSRAAAELALGDNTDEQGVALGATPTTGPKTNDDIVAELKKQNDLLAQQNQTLQDQKSALQTVVQNTTPPTPPTPVPEIDKSDLLVQQIGLSKRDPTNNAPYGEYSFRVSVLDKNGKYRNDAIVTVQLPSDDLYEVLQKQTSSPRTRTVNAVTSSPLNDWYVVFSYVPTTTGQKTLTFTSGPLTKSLTIQVSQ